MVLASRRRVGLRAWLQKHHTSSASVWAQVARTDSPEQTASFQDLLEEGLCFGWSESKRRSGNERFDLQRFAPRRTVGTLSVRNRLLAVRLTERGRMTRPCSTHWDGPDPGRFSRPRAIRRLACGRASASP